MDRSIDRGASEIVGGAACRQPTQHPLDSEHHLVQIMRLRDIVGLRQLSLGSPQILEPRKTDSRLQMVVGTDVGCTMMIVLDDALAPTLKTDAIAAERGTIHQLDHGIGDQLG